VTAPSEDAISHYNKAKELFGREKYAEAKGGECQAMNWLRNCRTSS